MTGGYPRTITLQGPNVTARDPRVRALVFDYLADRHGSGSTVSAVASFLLDNGHNPEAAKVLVREWRKAGALSAQVVSPGPSTTYYRLRA